MIRKRILVKTKSYYRIGNLVYKRRDLTHIPYRIFKDDLLTIKSVSPYQGPPNGYVFGITNRVPRARPYWNSKDGAGMQKSHIESNFDAPADFFF